VLGTEELFQYLDHYDLELESQFDGLIGRHAAKPWNKFITSENEHLCSEEALSFVGGLLKYDHQERLTAQEAMAHPYFAPVRLQAAQDGQAAAEVIADDSAASS
jgi:casein kinase II subunit alpha